MEILILIYSAMNNVCYVLVCASSVYFGGVQCVCVCCVCLCVLCMLVCVWSVDLTYAVYIIFSQYFFDLTVAFKDSFFVILVDAHEFTRTLQNSSDLYDSIACTRIWSEYEESHKYILYKVYTLYIWQLWMQNWVKIGLLT